jgi:23S rRNA (cytidine1920-2'-O)/16S rRNA (cytidine1409-2'-O)-methyltransferase
MRLDQFLVNNSFVDSRNKASFLIKNNKVTINGILVSKSSFCVNDSDNIEVLEEYIYVSRSAMKLRNFISSIEINLHDFICLDVGASTGGFTQILLENGARQVFAIDVGQNQLHDTLKTDSRVISVENTDIRSFSSDIVFNLVVCDVSFISIDRIMEALFQFRCANFILLFKPQFEVGRNVKRNKKGVVVDKLEIDKALEVFANLLSLLGLKVISIEQANPSGKDGNIEYFYYLQR